LSNFFGYLIGQKALKENPAAAKTQQNPEGIEKKKIVRNKEPKSISREAEKTLNMCLAEANAELLRIKAVAISTGLRARELANVYWSDLDFENATIRVSEKPDWKPKDYEERVIPLNATALKALREQKIERSVLGRYVFCRQDGKKYGRGMDLAMSRAFKKAGLGSGGLHSLRHSFATRYLEAGWQRERPSTIAWA